MAQARCLRQLRVLNDQGSFIFFQLVFNSGAFFNTHNVVRSPFVRVCLANVPDLVRWKGFIRLKTF